MQLDEQKINNRPLLSVIIPAYNEESRIVPTLNQVVDFILKQPWAGEVIVVSDGSVDRTVEIAKTFQQDYPWVRVVDNKVNNGKGYVVRQGMIVARGHYRLFMDADSSTQITEVNKLFEYIEPIAGFIVDKEAGLKYYDVIIGSLGVEGARIDKKEFFLRLIAGKIGNWLIQLIVLSGIQDTQRGFKLFTSNAAEKIFPVMRIDRWGFDIEVLALARKFKFLIKEVPVSWSHDTRSKISTAAYFQVLLELVKIRWWLWKK